MGWVVIAQYGTDILRTEFVGRKVRTKEEALTALGSAVHTYTPSRNIIEKRRRVYRFPDRESYLVVLKGKLTEWEITLTIADSTDPSVAERARASDATAGGT